MSIGQLRDFVILLLDTGARFNEVAQLKWSQIDLENRTLHLYREKVKNESILHLTKRALTVLTTRYHDRGRSDDVFTSISYHTATLNRAYKRAGVKDASGYHVLRHTFASRLAAAGVSLLKIGELLGHTNYDSTTIYAHLVQSDASKEAVDILDRTSPVGYNYKDFIVMR
jgi:integrase